MGGELGKNRCMYGSESERRLVTVMSDSLGSHGLSAASSSVHGNLQAREDWNGLPFSSPGDLPDPGIEPGSPALREDALPSEPPG